MRRPYDRLVKRLQSLAHVRIRPSGNDSARISAQASGPARQRTASRGLHGRFLIGPALKWLACASLLALGGRTQAIPAGSGGAELTGLVEFGSVHLACVRLGQSGESLALHPGETASGITLKEMQVKEGWALFEQGTNQFRLRLANYCASGGPQAVVADGQPAIRRQSRRIEAANSSLPGQDSPGAAQSVADNNGAPTQDKASSNPMPPAWMLPYLAPGPVSQNNGGDSQAPVTPAHEPGPPPQSQSSAATAPAGLAASDLPVEVTNPAGAAASSGVPATVTHASRQNAGQLSPEAEQVLMFGGRAAYMAWDIQQWRERQAAAGAPGPSN